MNKIQEDIFKSFTKKTIQTKEVILIAFLSYKLFAEHIKKIFIVIIK